MLSVVEFAEQIIAADDLDPIYTLLRGSNLPWLFRARWCVAYWMYYHAGTASQIVSAPSFWDAAEDALPKAPRGRERRHFRGPMAVTAVRKMRERYHDASTAPLSLIAAGTDAGAIMDRVEEWHGFGSWIAFKAADMCSTVLEHPVDFSRVLDRFYVEPLKGAVVVGSPGYSPEAIDTTFLSLSPAARLQTLRESLGYLGTQLAHIPNPYAPGPLRIQELETILCKYKAHYFGRYHIGEDKTAMLRALDAVPSACERWLRDPVITGV